MGFRLDPYSTGGLGQRDGGSGKANCLREVALATDKTHLAQGDLGLLAEPMSSDRPFIEESREFLGLGILLVACATNVWLIPLKKD